MVNKMYSDLFIAICQNNEHTFERVADKKTGEEAEKYLKNRDNFAELEDRIRNNPDAELTQQDWARLYVGANLAMNTIERQIEQLHKVVDMYDTKIIPKLLTVIKAKSDKEVVSQTFDNVE